MRVHESGIDHNAETPTTPVMPSTTLAPSVCTTTNASSVANADTADLTCPHCPSTFTSRIGLVGHLRIHRTETGEPVPGAPTYAHQARLNCPHCPRTFRHRETTPSVHLLAPNSHLWLHVAGLCSAATPRATVSTGGLNQMRALCTCAECTAYRGLRWMDGRMKHCAGIVETRLCLVRRWTTAAGTGLCIAFAETRPPSPTETADSRHMRSFSTTNIKVVAP
nr:unnamed protein product [Spirometra erinaceieuropaei]